MRRLIAILLRRRHCSCDPRFVGVAHDLECPAHGLEATLRGAA